jgi:catechol 2,3-dioxygenase
VTLPADASLAGLSLRVRDLSRMTEYYTKILGLERVSQDDGTVVLAPADGLFELSLVHDPDAPQRPYPCPGLYHFALVVPGRAELGAIFRRLIELGESFEGMADHLVSEALYIRDPELNGIELYRDRPKNEWERTPDGGVRMVSDPIDADGVLASADGPAPLDRATRFGHIHHHVRDLGAAEEFFGGTLGLNRTATMPGALFFAAGDYHHHVGTNTWAPDTPIPDGATGLLSYTFRVPGGWTGPSELTDPIGATIRITSG